MKGDHYQAMTLREGVRPGGHFSTTTSRIIVIVSGVCVLVLVLTSTYLLFSNQLTQYDVHHLALASCGDADSDHMDKRFDQKRMERVKAMDSSLGDLVSFDLYEPEATRFSEC